MGKGRGLMWLTVVVSCAAGAASFVSLHRLGNDPLPGLGATFRAAAFLQLIPFAAASALAVCLRRHPDILRFLLAAVIGCGAYGWWWLDGLAELRHWENQPVTRGALGNIFPDLEGQIGAAAALLWPAVVLVIIGVATLIGLSVSRSAKRIPGPVTENEKTGT